MNKNVLMITYFYPPMTAVGKNRTLRFQKHLPKTGYHPVVHSVKNFDLRSVSISTNEKQLKGEIHRSRAINLGFIATSLNWIADKLARLFGKDLRSNPVSQHLLLPDLQIGWIPFCLWKSVSIAKTREVDLIYVSCSPFSAALTGVLLKKLIGKPLVLDFRDPWSFNHSYTQFPIAACCHRMFEKFAIRSTDWLIANTRTASEKYKTLYPEKQNVISHIYNGINSSAGIEALETKTFVMLYTGAVYGHRYVKILLAAVERAFADNDDVRLYFTGAKREAIATTIAELNLDDKVKETGYISREQLDELQSKASVLHFCNGFDEKGDLNQFVIKSKLYDYLATGLPIIALAASGEVAEIIIRYSENSCVISDDYDSKLEQAMIESYENWKKNGRTRNVKENFTTDFNPESQTQQLSKIFDTVINATGNTMKIS